MNPDQASQNIAQLRQFKLMIDKTAQEVIANAMTNTAELCNTVVDALEERVRNISAPILEIKVNDIKSAKLDKPAASILKELCEILSANEPAYIFGPAGCGKTTAVEQAAQVLELGFYHFVFSPDMGVTSVFGRQTPTGFVDSIIVKAAKLGGLLFLDEADNGAPETLKALNGLGDKSGRLYNPVTGEEITIHESFRLVLAGNTNGLGADAVYTAANRQDGSTLSRFTYLFMDYDKTLEKHLAKSYTDKLELLKRLQDARDKLRSDNRQEIISTRHIERIHKLRYRLNWTEERALHAGLTAPWPEGLADELSLKNHIPF